jgi:hypothetical protein
MAEDRLPFLGLDFLYVPSVDVASDARFFTDVLGGRLVFAVEAMGARVAMVQLTESPPSVLLADHLDGHRPILIYRVPDLREAMAELEGRGLAARQDRGDSAGALLLVRDPGRTSPGHLRGVSSRGHRTLRRST